jgi:Family of unknown function (DUF6603)
MEALRQIADELIAALAPLVDGARDPEKLQSLLAQLGWTPNSVPQPVRDALASGARLLDVIGSGADPIEAAEVVALVTRLAAAVNAIANSPDNAFPGGIDVATFKATIARDLLDYAFATHLLHHRTRLGLVLKLAGLLRLVDTPASGARQRYLKYEVPWSRLGTLLTDPARGFREAFDWESTTPGTSPAVVDVGSLLEVHGLTLFVSEATEDLLAFINAGATTPLDKALGLDMALVALLPETAETQAGIQLVAFPPTTLRGPAIGVLPYAHLGGAKEVKLSDTLSLTIGGTADFTRGIAILLAPGQPPEVKAGFLGGVTAVPPEVRLGLKLTPAPGEPERRLFGAADASRLAINALGLAIGARLASPGELDAFVEVQADGAHVVVKPAPDEADSFLGSLLGSEGISAEMSFAVRLSSRSGFGFTGSGGLEASFPLHVDLGPIEFQGITLGVKPRGQDLDVEVGATIAGRLGPLAFVVERAGFKLIAQFPDPPTGNLGPLNLGFGFQPPNGVGLSIDAGPVKGGGYLFFDSDREEYAGVLELAIADIVTVKAIGLITTRMPDGSKGFSLLIIITAEFGTGIQLGFGFTLVGLGGLLGLNRTMNLQLLVEGVRTGAVNSIMFPQNPVANAPRIISDLSIIFPPYEGRFLIGPMAKLGWGTPALVTASLGIIIEITGNIAIVGVLKVALPAADAPLIVIQANFVGAIEFDKQRLYFFAALYESRIVFLTLEGELGLLVAWGPDANFVLSAGGFHPRFNPPPLPFPAPRRIAVSLLNTSLARIRTETYFAVTSNTVQFGSNTEVMFDVDVARVDGHLSFDALFRFSPFYFVIEVSASVSLKVFGVGLFSIHLHFELSGPSPYRAHGTGSLSLFFFDVSADFDITWGETQGTTLPPLPVMPLLQTELAKAENWKAELPIQNKLLVSLRKLPESESAQVLHPLGGLRVSQRAVPLGLKIDKVGSQKPSDANEIRLTASAGLVRVGDAPEQFAKAQFLDMSDAQKLSQRAFDPLSGGLLLASGSQQLGASRLTKRRVRYEEIIIDTNYLRFRRRFKIFTRGFFDHFLKGGAVSKSTLSNHYKTQLDPFVEKLKVTEGGFTVAHTENNQPFAAQAHFASEAQAKQYLDAQVAARPELHDSLHVIPQYEAAA